ncbi:transposase [Patescibacteria group bacterium]|nr:transposase [Patescibacteria group bacterium]
MGRYLEFIKTYRLLHRNSQKHIIFKDAYYFVTIKTHNNLLFFREHIFGDLFVAIGSEVSKIVTKLLRCKYGEEAQARRENLQFCKQLKGFLLFAWVICYEHVHLLLQPNDKWNISDVIHSLKRHTSRNMNILVDSISESADSYPHFQSEVSYRFLSKFKWQKSFYDHYIRNDRDFDHHMDTIERNPVKHGLPPDWPYIYINPKYEDLTDDCI